MPIGRIQAACLSEMPFGPLELGSYRTMRGIAVSVMNSSLATTARNSQPLFTLEQAAQPRESPQDMQLLRFVHRKLVSGLVLREPLRETVLDW